MNKKCLKFRDYFLQESDGMEMNPDQQRHFDECADCREFMDETRQAMDFLQREKEIAVPPGIEEKLQQRLFRPQKSFRPLYAIAFAVFVLFISVLQFTKNSDIPFIPQKHALYVEKVCLNGKPVNVYLSEEENYVNIFIPSKGE